ncbi:MAG: transporter substrate-binding domain-containing protein [Pseudomonadota bacterium]
MKLKKRGQSFSRMVFAMICCAVFQGLVVQWTPVSAKEASYPAILTSAETAWLQAHPIIRLAPDPEFKPIEFFDQDGLYTGLAADFTHLLEQKLGIRFEIVRCRNWDDVMDRMSRHEVDILNAVVKTPQRETFLNFSQPYLKIPSVIIVRKNVDADLTLDMLSGMNIVMISGYGYVDLIHNNYPELNIALVPDLKTALRKVSFGMADAFIGDLATASFYIESEGITNLRLAGETEPPNISGFAVRSDWPELTGILEKGLGLITGEEKRATYNKWIHLGPEPGVTWREFKNLMVIILGSISLIILVFLVWNRSLKRMVNLRTEDLRKEIEERRRAQEALGESEAHLRTLLKTIPDLVWLKDPDGLYLACNARFERFFGAREETIKGKTDYDFVSKDLADFFRQNDRVAIEKGSPSINEEEVVYADDGHHELLETIKTPIYGSNGQLIGVLGIARDITDRKHAENERKKLEDQLRQSHKMEAIGTIAGGIAHEFNNILGVIVGNTELAEDSVEDWNPARLNLEEIKKASLRARDIIKQLLNFSRKTEQTKKMVDMGLLIQESIHLLRSSMPKSIDIQLSLPEKLGMIKADPTQINQVLINLCTNAAHAMEENGGSLRIDLSERQLDTGFETQFQSLDAGRYIQLEISDTGHGIAPAIQTKIFDPYFTTKDVGKGTGMGLAVVLGIVKSHNGAISVYSEQGRGSTFKVLFPVAESGMADREIPK